MKVFKLKKEISSPHFTRVIPAGTIYTEGRLKNYFPFLFWSSENNTLKEWFEDVSNQYEIKNCILTKKTSDYHR